MVRKLTTFDKYIIEALGIESTNSWWLDKANELLHPYKNDLFLFDYMILFADNFYDNPSLCNRKDIVVTEIDELDIIVYHNVDNVKFNYNNTKERNIGIYGIKRMVE